MKKIMIFLFPHCEQDPVREVQPLWEETVSAASSPGDITVWELSTVSFNMTEKGQHNETSEDGLHVFILSRQLVLVCLCLLISLLGLVGNGIVFRFLCFQIKQNKFTVYILNLTLVDLLMLSSFSVLYLYILSFFPGSGYSEQEFQSHILPLHIFIVFGYFNGLLLLTAISVERYLAILFPIWYHCQRPKHQSAIVCALLWMLSCTLTAVDYFFCDFDMVTRSLGCTAVNIITATLSFLVVTPLMIFSNLMLFVKIWKRRQQRSPPKLYIVIVASVLTFLVFTLSAQLWNYFIYFRVITVDKDSVKSYFYWTVLSCSINSTANPFIYFLVGRQKERGAQGFIKLALQRVFKEETDIPKREEGTLASNTAESNL
ncbi:mas-related G-protein coupled receptor member H-like [Rhinatrema bivittatum]|uniref:mas-related G-protein coupled receptor member H-like n=1 Tax=Rhinatrema bivittatum TaxID=194408 RepID=UPI0011292931|nr:mas-related G-protein coupled receptor member H-like [Rhinatrema bivittatum]